MAGLEGEIWEDSTAVRPGLQHSAKIDRSEKFAVYLILTVDEI